MLYMTDKTYESICLICGKKTEGIYKKTDYNHLHKVGKVSIHFDEAEFCVHINNSKDNV